MTPSLEDCVILGRARFPALYGVCRDNFLRFVVVVAVGEAVENSVVRVTCCRVASQRSGSMCKMRLEEGMVLVLVLVLEVGAGEWCGT